MEKNKNILLIIGIIIIVLAIIGAFLIFGQNNNYTENVTIDSEYKIAMDNVVSINVNAKQFIDNNDKISYDLNKGSIRQEAMPNVNSQKNNYEKLNKSITSLNNSINNLKKTAETSDEKEYLKLLENYLNKTMVLFDLFTSDKNLLVKLENNEITWGTWVYGVKCSKYIVDDEVKKKFKDYDSSGENITNFIESHPDFANKYGLNN